MADAVGGEADVDAKRLELGGNELGPAIGERARCDTGARAVAGAQHVALGAQLTGSASDAGRERGCGCADRQTEEQDRQQRAAVLSAYGHGGGGTAK
jgi:hypothetical protein